jgi:hypothetical protein
MGALLCRSGFPMSLAHLLEQALPVCLNVIDIEYPCALPAQEPFQPGLPLD